MRQWIFHGRRKTILSRVPRKRNFYHQQAKAEIGQAAAIAIEETSPGRT
jgi:hypothetical protein